MSTEEQFKVPTVAQLHGIYKEEHDKAMNVMLETEGFKHRENPLVASPSERAATKTQLSKFIDNLPAIQRIYKNLVSTLKNNSQLDFMCKLHKKTNKNDKSTADSLASEEGIAAAIKEHLSADSPAFPTISANTIKRYPKICVYCKAAAIDLKGHLRKHELTPMDRARAEMASHAKITQFADNSFVDGPDLCKKIQARDYEGIYDILRKCGITIYDDSEDKDYFASGMGSFIPGQPLDAQPVPISPKNLKPAGQLFVLPGKNITHTTLADGTEHQLAEPMFQHSNTSNVAYTLAFGALATFLKCDGLNTSADSAAPLSLYYSFNRTKKSILSAAGLFRDKNTKRDVTPPLKFYSDLCFALTTGFNTNTRELNNLAHLPLTSATTDYYFKQFFNDGTGFEVPLTMDNDFYPPLAQLVDYKLPVYGDPSRLKHIGQALASKRDGPEKQQLLFFLSVLIAVTAIDFSAVAASLLDDDLNQSDGTMDISAGNLTLGASDVRKQTRLDILVKQLFKSISCPLAYFIMAQIEVEEVNELFKTVYAPSADSAPCLHIQNMLDGKPDYITPADIIMLASFLCVNLFISVQFKGFQHQFGIPGNRDYLKSDLKRADNALLSLNVPIQFFTRAGDRTAAWVIEKLKRDTEVRGAPSAIQLKSCAFCFDINTQTTYIVSRPNEFLPRRGHTEDSQESQDDGE